jgi:hypothetical protein
VAVDWAKALPTKKLARTESRMDLPNFIFDLQKINARSRRTSRGGVHLGRNDSRAKNWLRFREDRAKTRPWEVNNHYAYRRLAHKSIRPNRNVLSDRAMSRCRRLAPQRIAHSVSTTRRCMMPRSCPRHSLAWLLA